MFRRVLTTFILVCALLAVTSFGVAVVWGAAESLVFLLVVTALFFTVGLAVGPVWLYGRLQGRTDTASRFFRISLLVYPLVLLSLVVSKLILKPREGRRGPVRKDQFKTHRRGSKRPSGLPVEAGPVDYAGMPCGSYADRNCDPAPFPWDL